MNLYIIFLVASLAAFINSLLGMGYGTILTPILVMAGYEPKILVPNILLSQLVVDVTGGVFHLKNRNFSGKDVKTVIAIAIPATVLSTLGALTTVNTPSIYLKLYIGALITAIGLLVITGKRFNAGYKGLGLIGVFAGFNKGLMGGGFGPIVASGQIFINREFRSSIAVGNISEITVCIAGLLTFIKTAGQYTLTFALPICIPAAAAAAIGPYLTRAVGNRKDAPRLLGALTMLLGICVLTKVLGI